jgi:hypothetical protein
MSRHRHLGFLMLAAAFAAGACAAYAQESFYGRFREQNEDLTALQLVHTFATGTYKNGALTDTWTPTQGKVVIDIS